MHHSAACLVQAPAGMSRYSSPIRRVRGRPGANDRPALPAGHPVTWGAITGGTMLDGAVYPYPVFVCIPRSSDRVLDAAVAAEGASSAGHDR